MKTTDTVAGKCDLNILLHSRPHGVNFDNDVHTVYQSKDGPKVHCAIPHRRYTNFRHRDVDHSKTHSPPVVLAHLDMFNKLRV
jgi:hypothetical protein